MTETAEVLRHGLQLLLLIPLTPIRFHYKQEKTYTEKSETSILTLGPRSLDLAHGDTDLFNLRPLLVTPRRQNDGDNERSLKSLCTQIIVYLLCFIYIPIKISFPCSKVKSFLIFCGPGMQPRVSNMLSKQSLNLSSKPQSKLNYHF